MRFLFVKNKYNLIFSMDCSLGSHRSRALHRHRPEGVSRSSPSSKEGGWSIHNLRQQVSLRVFDTHANFLWRFIVFLIPPTHYGPPRMSCRLCLSRCWTGKGYTPPVNHRE